MAGHQHLKYIVRKFPVVIYILLAFSITWGLKLLNVFLRTNGHFPSFNLVLIAQYGPSIAAVVLIVLANGREGLMNTFKSIINWKVGFKWIIIAFLFELVMFQLISLGYWIYYREFPIVYNGSVFSAFISFSGTFIMGLFFWGLSEEIGWRGWMFPKLQNQLSPFWASIILAFFTSLWHMDPNNLVQMFDCTEGAFLWGCYPPIVERLIVSIPMVLVITYIFNNTNGSLLVMMIFHSSSNTSYFWTDEMFGIVLTDYFKAMFLVIVSVLFVVFSLLVIYSPKKVTFDQH